MIFLSKLTPTIKGKGDVLSFEEKYGLLLNNIAKYLDNEEALASGAKDGSATTIYTIKHPCYDLFATIYANMFIPAQRDTVEKIFGSQRQAMNIKRVRSECLTIYSLCGEDFVKRVIKNCIDGIVGISGITGRTSQALRRELEKFFAKNTVLWYCIVANSIYSIGFSQHGIANRKLPADKSTI